MKNTVLGLLMMGLSCAAQAGIVVIGHAQGVDTLTADAVKQLYLGKDQRLPNGATVQLYELPEGAVTRLEFHSKTTGRNDAQLQSNWSRLVFTGKAVAPVVVADPAAMIAAIQSQPNAIGYLDEAAVTAEVKVLLKL